MVQDALYRAYPTIPFFVSENMVCFEVNFTKAGEAVAKRTIITRYFNGMGTRTSDAISLYCWLPSTAYALINVSATPKNPCSTR